MRKLIFIFLLLVSFRGVSQITIDYFDVSSNTYYSEYASGTHYYGGQSFKNLAQPMILTSIKVSLAKVLSPSGNSYVKVYAHSGTYGTSSVPTGSALATSDPYDVAGLTTSEQFITFTFSGANQITLSTSTYYVLEFYCPVGDASNYVKLYRRTGVGATHEGNSSYGSITPTWTYDGGDTKFYVYGNPAGPTVSISSTTNVKCYGGSTGGITASVTRGTSPYTYKWSNSITTNPITGIGIGTYTVTVTDNAAGTGTASATLTQPASALTGGISVQTNVSCHSGNDGAATVTASGGITAYTYLWSNSGTAATTTALSKAIYTVTVTDANACTLTASATITEPGVISKINGVPVASINKVNGVLRCTQINKINGVANK
jgi:hypothetical protein